MLEEEYDNLALMVNFSMPGKYLLYLCPCKLNTVIWDDRFAMMIDPVRSTMFAVYAKEFNSVYPFLIAQAAVYHNYGYAPPFLADGFANYSSFAIYDMKKLKAEGGLIPLDSLLDTYAYYQTDPHLSDRMSATFVRYLVDQYRLATFLDLYRKSDDLNLRTQIEETYGKKINQLEAEWLKYVDTVQITYAQSAAHAMIAETRLDYASAYQYSREMYRLAADRRDSLEALGQMSRGAFFAGDYYAAADEQIRFLNLLDTVAGEWMKLAGYQMMNGEYDRANTSLERAARIDSTNSLVRFNRALLKMSTGDTLKARELLQQVIQSGAPSGGMIESQVMLAGLLNASGSEADKREALNHYSSVVATLARQDQRHNPSVSQAMWLGIAYLGTGDTGNAEDFLQTALFLETRPFYQGMILLWLGKVADVRGERQLARDYYEKVLAGASADYHQEEARRLLERPYRR
jgi:tetratricopeptide (TPR) repeat protein